MPEVGAGVRVVTWLLDRWSDLRRRRQRQHALRLEFENTDAHPFLVQMYDNGQTWRCYRVGLSNSHREPLREARVIVERIKTRADTHLPEYRLRQSNDHKDSASVLSREFAQPVMFDLVEQWNESERLPSDWAWLCYADKDPKGPPHLPVGKTEVLLRAEADGAKPVRMRLLIQTRTPRAQTLSGERDVRRTVVLVRRVG